MAIKKRKPTNPASRFQEYSSFDEITTSTPEKSLTRGRKRGGGRNNGGRVTVRFRGGRHRRRYRDIDFRRDKTGVPATVASIEYDPNRTARICLLNYADGEKRYILWPIGLKVGDTVMAGEESEVDLGNALPLHKIPLGTIVHNVELKQGRGGQMVRSAGAGAQVMAKEGAYAQLKLPSGEVRRVHVNCTATIGQLGNAEQQNISLGKAGRSRWAGRRPPQPGRDHEPRRPSHGWR